MQYLGHDETHTKIKCGKCGNTYRYKNEMFLFGDNFCTPTDTLKCECGSIARGNIFDLEVQSEPDIVRCPKCGSTQIQMIPRKWSPLTGFLTNKVDRVCVNCKHKF